MKNQIFNASKTLEEYKAPDLFFGTAPGLFDSVHKKYPKIWGFYKEMKSLDWSEDEFDYSQCRLDFMKCDPSVRDKMIKTLAYQWEQDTVACKSIAPVMAPFITNSELWAAWQRISDNEVVHALTYSEIIRLSFDDSEAVMAEILEIKEAMTRMETTNNTLAELFKASHLYALGKIKADDELKRLVYKGIASIFMLERIQFMASFAVTFTICAADWFQPIGKAVQKIAQDELEVHAQFGKEVLKQFDLQFPGIANSVKSDLDKMLEEVIQSEFEWLDYLFSDGKGLLGTNKDLMKKWVLFNARDVKQTLGLDSDHSFPLKNPMPHLEHWLNINKVQSAPQEQDNAAYKTNVVVSDDAGQKFDAGF